jgi:hypothetical protein
LIGFEKQVEQRPSRSYLNDFGGVMPSPKERERSRARLQREAPVSDETTLLILQEQAADYIRESKRRDASGPDELASLHDLARDYFRHVQRKRLRRKGAF